MKGWATRQATSPRPVRLFSNLSGASLLAQMDDARATRSRVSVSTRLKELIRERPKLTITLNIERLRTLLIFLGFEAFVAWCSYVYFPPSPTRIGAARNFLEVFASDFSTPHGFLIASMVLGAFVFWLVRLLILFRTARWLTSLVLAYCCLLGRNYLVASIFLCTALLVMAIADLRPKD
jgi:hypothetical protein